MTEIGIRDPAGMNMFVYFSRAKILIICLLLTAWFLEGCSKKRTQSSDDQSSSPPNPNNRSLCREQTISENAITLKGKAVFEYRVPSKQGLGAIEDSTKNIRHASIDVLSSQGCVTASHTDRQGAFSIKVPYREQEEYTIQVNARASNEHINITVQDEPANFQHYFISKTITLEDQSDVTDIVITASADEQGGAFNIYDQILEANIFLREQTKNCHNFIPDCIPFTQAPKVYVYWKKGLNPVTHFIKDATSSFSFYLPGRRQLFIVGGSNGDIIATNTDHFDNIIILHEYGHFLEDTFSKTDTPGGSHNARYVIDPRLAWSEGFATFFANAVFGRAVYIDSVGISPNGLLKINENLESHPPKRDVSKATGEGNFREFSITRTLWDIIDPYTHLSKDIEDQDNDSIDGGSFGEIWSVFSLLFKDTQYYFRDFGLFMSLHNNLENKTDISLLLEREMQKANREDFASPFPIPTDRQSSECPKKIRATDADKREQNRLVAYPKSSNQHSSNDFYLYEHRGGTLSVELTYNPTDQDTPDDKKADLDLLVYKNGYTYLKDDDILTSSRNRDDEGTESIRVSAEAGAYMINVMVWTRRGESNNKFLLGSESTYNLTINEDTLCP